jgi:hypothetical protein
MLAGVFFDILAVFPNSGGGDDSLLGFWGGDQVGDYCHGFTTFGD